MSLKSKIKTMVIISGGAFVVYTTSNVYQGNGRIYKELVLPILLKFDAETAHKLAITAASYNIIVPKSRYKDPVNLGSQIKHLKFSNPIGIAAGFDKDGKAVSSLAKIGFGFIEVGSVTPEPQEGNNRPRIFRLLEDRAIINRCGFNNEGHDIVQKRLRKIYPRKSYVLGVNLGKNKESTDAISDYTRGITKFADVADYFVINISSPNTPGLRDLQKGSEVKNLLEHVLHTRNSLPNNPKPLVFLKLSPDLSTEEKKHIAHIISEDTTKVDGLVIANTTITRPRDLKSINKNETGGLSGKPLTLMSTEMIAEMYALTKGSIPIIGVGGISNGKDAYDKIKAGACLVQLYTGLIYEGPSLVTRIKKQLHQFLLDDNYNSISEAIGK